MSNLSTKTKVIIVAVALVTSFAVGRYSTPVKTETKIVTVTKEVETKHVDSSTNDHKKTVIHETTKPSGEKEITTIITDDRSSDTKVDDNKTTDVTKVDDKTKVTSDSRVTVSALGGYDLNKKALVYGGSIQKPVLGPITLGAFALTSPTVGISLGLQF